MAEQRSYDVFLSYHRAAKDAEIAAAYTTRSQR